MAQKCKSNEAAAAIEYEINQSNPSLMNKTQIQESSIIVKPFIAGPIYSNAQQPFFKNEKYTTRTEQNVSLECGHMQINFRIKQKSNDWNLEVINNKETNEREYSMIFSSKESISRIHEYLQVNNLPALLEFLKQKGVTANLIAQYLEGETKDFANSPRTLS